MRAESVAACDVLVIGCGPAGASAAARLARRGVDVVAVDRSVTPRDRLCGDFLTPGTLALLESEGLIDAAARERGRPLRGMRLVLDETVVPLPFGAVPGLALGRRDLDAGLVRAARASGARVLEGIRVEAVAQGPGGIEARGADRSGRPIVVAARAAIDAGGRNALVPRRRGWRRPSRWPVRYAVGAWFEGVRGLSDHGEMHVLGAGASGYIGISPIGDGLAGAAAVVGRPLFEASRRDAAGLLDRLIASSRDLARRFAGARRVTPTRGAGPLAHGSRRYGEGRLVVAGDAAAFVDPFTGEGIQAALVSGLLAAEAAASIARLDADGASRDRERVVRAYARDLRAALLPRFTMSRVLQALLAAPPLARRVAAALERREDLAAAVIAVTGGGRDPRSLLRAGFVKGIVLEAASAAPSAGGSRP